MGMILRTLEEEAASSGVASGSVAVSQTAGQAFTSNLGWLVVILVSIAGAFMTLYAVYIGYLFATASDPNKRQIAKSRLMKVISSALIVVALAFVLSVIQVNFNGVTGSITGPRAGKASNSAFQEGSGGDSSDQYEAGQIPTMIFRGKNISDKNGKADEVWGSLIIDASRFTLNGQGFSGDDYKKLVVDDIVVTNPRKSNGQAYDCWNYCEFEHSYYNSNGTKTNVSEWIGVLNYHWKREDEDDERYKIFLTKESGFLSGRMFFAVKVTFHFKDKPSDKFSVEAFVIYDEQMPYKSPSVRTTDKDFSVYVV